MSRLLLVRVFAIVAAMCLVGEVSNASGEIRVYRVRDFGMPGVPVLNKDQRAWLKTVIDNPFWKERLPHLWFAPTRKENPVVVYYDDTVVRVTTVQGVTSGYSVVPAGSRPAFAGYATEHSALVRVSNLSPAPESRGVVSDVALQASPFSPFSFDGDDLYYTDSKGHLVDRDVAKHRVRWVAPESVPFNATAVDRWRIYSIGPAEAVLARDKRSGTTIWETAPLHDGGNLSLTLIGTRLFALGTSITRIDTANGRTLWQSPASNFASVIGLGDTLFAHLVSGDPPSESIAAMDAQTGKELREFDPGEPVGTAHILGTDGDAVLVRAAAGEPSIDLDDYAIARVVWLNGRTGAVLKNTTYRPDSALYGPDTGLGQPVFLDGNAIVFEVAGSIYRYRLDERPQDQRPLRLQDAGDLIASRNGTIYLRVSDGLNAIRLSKNAGVRQRVMGFQYNPSLNEPTLAVGASAIAVSDGKTLSVLNLSDRLAHRYTADCGASFSILTASGRAAVQCGSASGGRIGSFYVVPL